MPNGCGVDFFNKTHRYASHVALGSRTVSRAVRGRRAAATASGAG